MKVPTMLVRSAGQLLGLCAHEAAASRRDSILISSAASLATLPWAGPGSQSREDQVVASSRLEYFPGPRGSPICPGLAASATAMGAQQADQQPILLYKGRGMQIFRLLVRFKIFQLLGVAALAIPINTLFAEGSLTGLQAVLASSLLIGCGVASAALYFYSRRYIGRLQYLPQARDPRLCFSVLDFWGHRQENWVQLRDLIAPFKDMSPESVAEAASKPLIPLDVAGDRQYYLSIRYGHIMDKRLLQSVLNGSLHPQDE